MLRSLWPFGFILAFVAAVPLAAASAERSAHKAYLTAAQMFALADAARQKGENGVAEAAYRALAADADIHVRAEARFRLGMMLVGLGRPADAGLLFRKVLDEQPNAQPVRLQLARVLDVIGDEAGARRVLREARAGGLPPDVSRLVDRYSAALRAQKPFGAGLELALAPDSNINRATRADTLGTVLGDFTLNEDAKQRSGIGAAIRGQAYGRLRLADDVNLLVRASAAGDFYKQEVFNDMSLGVTAGPELRLGRARATAELGLTRRWFGGDAYSTTGTMALNYLRPLGRSQLRATAAMGLIDNHRNDLQDGRTYALTVGYERALSSRSGIGLTIGAERQHLSDPGYSSTAGQVTLFGYREFGPTTLIGTLGHGRLAADERLLLYPDARKDRYYRASLGIALRQFSVGRFAPLLRVTTERNRSNVEIFDYRRTRTEFAITRTF